MSTLPDARASIADVTRQLNALSAALARGDAVDVSALDQAVQMLCEITAALPRQTGQKLRGELMALYQDLDRLEREMRAAHEALARQLKGLSRGTQTTQAYGRQPSKS